MKINKQRLIQRVFFWGLGITSACILFLLFLIFAVYAGWFGKLPGTDDLIGIDQDNASLVYSKDETLMGKYYITNRQTINNELISPYVRQALIATEDNRFFEHHGIDVISLGRVLFKSIIMGNISQGGGSTIHQQLAKNLFGRKDYKILSLPINKIREIFIASKLEDNYSKEEILTLYLNTVSFGEEVYGIEAASWRFFNKPSAQLSISESATLVGMLAANTTFNPRLNPERSESRKNTVLSRMVTQGFITEEEAQRCKDKPIELDYNVMDINRGIAPYFREYIRKQANKLLREKYGDQYHLETDGLLIYTTINTHLQSFAEVAVTKHMKVLQSKFDNHWKNTDPWHRYPEIFQDALKSTLIYQDLKANGMSDSDIQERLSIPHKMQIFTHDGERVVEKSTIDSVRYYLRMLNTGFLAVDPKSGAILAWVGGINHKYKPYDHILSKRQVGSTFKPLVYTAAMIKGLEPCRMIANEQRVYEQYDNWSPSNSGGDTGGYYSMRGGLINSVNTITTEVMMEAEVENVVALAHRLGIDAYIPEVPSIALGSAEISLYEMIEAYSAFANNGYTCKPYGITKILDSNGKLLYENIDHEPSAPVFEEYIGLLLSNMLQGVVDSGTGKSLRTIYGVTTDVAGKTGTTQNNADGWFICYTPNIVAGCWTGAELPSIHFRTTALGSGAHQALPVVGLVINSMEQDPLLRNNYLSVFPPLPDSLLDIMDCPDFALKNPDDNVFDKVLDIFQGSDSVKNERKLKRAERKKTKEQEKEKEGLIKRIGKIFKKK